MATARERHAYVKSPRGEASNYLERPRDDCRRGLQAEVPFKGPPTMRSGSNRLPRALAWLYRTTAHAGPQDVLSGCALECSLSNACATATNEANQSARAPAQRVARRGVGNPCRRFRATPMVAVTFDRHRIATATQSRLIRPGDIRQM